jgi:outer membrane protein assembly factor BamB
MVFVMSGHRGSSLKAIRLGTTGNLAGTDAIAWSLEEGTPYVPSPLLYQGRLYFTQSNENRLTCADAATGRIHFQERVEQLRQLYASPVAAAGHLYLVDREGGCVVLEAGETLKIVSSNSLDDNFDASPAIAGDEIFLRGSKHLYCIASK